MLKLEDIKRDAQVHGIMGNDIVRVITVEPQLRHRYRDALGVCVAFKRRNFAFNGASYRRFD
jgi:hypothetical protein